MTDFESVLVYYVCCYFYVSVVLSCIVSKSGCVCCYQLVERLKQQGERAMIEKREKTMIELSKLKQRIDEFNDYGELEMMQQVRTWRLCCIL